MNLTGGAIRTGIYGERLFIQRKGETDYREVEGLPKMRGAWEQFCQVRAGELENPCPPEVGLRMQKSGDAIVSRRAKNGIARVDRVGDRVQMRRDARQNQQM